MLLLHMGVKDSFSKRVLRWVVILVLLIFGFKMLLTALGYIALWFGLQGTI